MPRDTQSRHLVRCATAWIARDPDDTYPSCLLYSSIQASLQLAVLEITRSFRAGKNSSVVKP